MNQEVSPPTLGTGCGGQKSKSAGNHAQAKWRCRGCYREGIDKPFGGQHRTGMLQAVVGSEGCLQRTLHTRRSTLCCRLTVLSRGKTPQFRGCYREGIVMPLRIQRRRVMPRDVAGSEWLPRRILHARHSTLCCAAWPCPTQDQKFQFRGCYREVIVMPLRIHRRRVMH